jgi:hypothetical protein
MQQSGDLDEIVERFAATATQFCNTVDTAATLDRVDFLKHIYGLLPRLIDQAISFPDVALSERAEGENVTLRNEADVAQNYEMWRARYSLLGEKLDDWNSYWEVFNPTHIHDTEAVCGSLADDLADIYGDLSEPLNKTSMLPPDKIWAWQFSFSTHWGHHAVGALRTIHVRLQA